MFEQRLAGRSVAGIARELTERRVPCPSDVDPDRNRHRSGGPWTLRTIAVILANPRYTGRQVWDRQRTQRDSDHLVHRSAPAEGWVISASGAHPLDSHWVHGRPAYRCRHGRTSAHPVATDQAKIVYVREDVLLRELTRRLLTNQDRDSADAVTSMVGKLRNAGMMITHDGTTWSLTGGDLPLGHDRPAVG